MNSIRVRAIALTKENKLLLIRRSKPGTDPYYVFPGGGLEHDDNNELEKGLLRELSEEADAEVQEIVCPVYLIRRDKETEVEYEVYFLVKLDAWSGLNRSGPEFSESTEGQYLLEEFELSHNVISRLNIKPAEVKDYLCKKLLEGKQMDAIDVDFLRS
jgi:ADP-ribose pyrophosphatase YjhB (NUDIX family)